MITWTYFQIKATISIVYCLFTLLIHLKNKINRFWHFKSKTIKEKEKRKKHGNCQTWQMSNMFDFDLKFAKILS